MAAHVHRIKGRISNIYLIADRGICIVDAGSPNDYPAIRSYIEMELGRPFSDVDYIVPTHSHIEHMGNAPKLKKKSGGLIILPRRRVDPARGVFDNFKFLRKMPRAIIAGLKNNPGLLLYPHMHFQKVRADVVARDGMEMPGHQGWLILFTPGHSPESVCLYHRESGSLMSGDSIITIDGRASLPFGIWDMGAMESTIEKLKKLNVKRLFPGHGEPLAGDNILGSING